MENKIEQQYMEDEIDLKELFKTISSYKYSILFIMLLSFMGAFTYLYFKVSISAILI